MSFHQCPAGCLSGRPVNTEHQLKERVPPESFPRVTLASVHARGERVFGGRVLDQFHQVTALKLIFATVIQHCVTAAVRNISAGFCCLHRC